MTTRCFDSHLMPVEVEFFLLDYVLLFLTSRSPTPRSSPSGSPRLEEINKIPKAEKNLSRSPIRSPAGKGSQPSASNHGRDLSRSRSPGGTQKRVRKGRGFTERYSFVRKYRTPSPERSPDRSYRYGGRNIQRYNNNDR